MRLIALLFLLVSFTASYAQTDSLFIELSDGKVFTYSISEIQGLSWANTTTDVYEQQYIQNIIKSFVVHQNYPNPFNPSTSILYEIPNPGNVEVSIYDIQGCKIRSFDNKYQQPGNHTITWDGRNDAGISVSSGTYFCRIHFNNNFLTKKMLLIK